MIYLVDRRNRDAFETQLEEMYRQRHRVYVDKRGWKALARPDGREIDQFDNAEAVYLMKLAENGSVEGAVRLIPTNKPHLMRDVFAHVVTSGAIPNDEKIYEMTRCYVSEAVTDKRERTMAAGELLAAQLEYGLAKGLTDYSVVSDMYFLPIMLALGDGVNKLGEPYEYGEGTCMALPDQRDRPEDVPPRARAERPGAGLQPHTAAGRNIRKRQDRGLISCQPETVKPAAGARRRAAAFA